MNMVFDGGDGDLEDDGDKDNDDLDRVERWEGVRASSLVDKRHLETTWIIIDLIDGNHDDDDDGGDEYYHIMNCNGEEVKDNKKVSNRGRVFLGSENLQCWDQVKKSSIVIAWGVSNPFASALAVKTLYII